MYAVINGRLSRITANLKYVLTGIASILPKPVLDKIFIIFTMCRDPVDLTFEPEELKKYFGEEVDATAYICIDNPLCTFEKAIELEKKGKLKKEQKAKSVKKSFNEAREALKEMCCKIKKFERVYTQNFILLHEKKQAIEVSVLDMLSAYDNKKKLGKRNKGCSGRFRFCS